ncbi:MAG: hypothetical protein ACOX45_01425 [Acutalibacteraceae bacterium]
MAFLTQVIAGNTPTGADDYLSKKAFSEKARGKSVLRSDREVI